MSLYGRPDGLHKFHEPFSVLLSARSFKSHQFGTLCFGDHIEAQIELAGIESQCFGTQSVGRELEIAARLCLGGFPGCGLQVHNGDLPGGRLFNQVDVSLEGRNLFSEPHFKKFLDADYLHVGVKGIVEY